VGGGGQVFELFASENIKSDKMDLGVTVLTSLAGAHINDLAWTTLYNNVVILTESRGLHGVGFRGTGCGCLEGFILVSLFPVRFARK
jgi:hypothetical protein